ncbi:hypothetical protein BN873_810005 [Candidatus Competibacter denitrificans Run_A_D11]|uniref:Uncharacterized protein n=1 Tax=Candidatus Competibacter denitrificans Run_A_D11 TaxID=1400863 RepID=W6MCJ5_9GAMM|nr:hypothetical protein [Candidatus Competibacter denitrificans]CDI04070.1 hypothetical protein BN873_810005 [Candidatus Competibacter denitrificans Run_A_D11]HRC70876.1 hypothetical protein [Candidatus Competibacter denitrificans]
MTVTLDAMQLLSLLGGLLGGLFAVGRFLLSQFERRLDQRFASLDAARLDGQRVWVDTFNAHVNNEQREFEIVRNLQHEFLSLRADLAAHYIRRDELRDQLAQLRTHVQTVDEKIDRLILMRGSREHGDT